MPSDGETRTAVCAVGEGVAVAAVSRSEHVLKASFARGGVRGDRGFDLSFLTFGDGEVRVASHVTVVWGDDINSG